MKTMVERVSTVTFQGVDVREIDVQVLIAPGLPQFNIVGLADKAVGESRERVRAALHAIGLALPSKRVTVNLAPADVVKEGSHFDLPIALGVLAAMGVMPAEELAHYLVMGELALDGSIRAVAGVLPAAISASRGSSSSCCVGFSATLPRATRRTTLVSMGGSGSLTGARSAIRSVMDKDNSLAASRRPSRL